MYPLLQLKYCRRAIAFSFTSSMLKIKRKSLLFFPLYCSRSMFYFLLLLTLLQRISRTGFIYEDSRRVVVCYACAIFMCGSTKCLLDSYYMVFFLCPSSTLFVLFSFSFSISQYRICHDVRTYQRLVVQHVCKLILFSLYEIFTAFLFL